MSRGGATATALMDRLRGLLATRELIDAAIGGAIQECESASVDRTSIAALLGVHRSTLYRRYPVAQGGPVNERPEAEAERFLTGPGDGTSKMESEPAAPAPA